MYRRILFILTFVSGLCRGQQQISSPDTRVNVTVAGGNQLTLSATFNGQVILAPSIIGLSLHGITPNWVLGKATRVEKDENIFPTVPEKRKVIRDHYKQLDVKLKGNLSLQIRVYNDGFAYRFVSAIRDTVIVDEEIARYALPPRVTFYGSAVNKRPDMDIYHTSFEEPYLIKPVDSISTNVLFFSPVMVAYSNGMKAVVTESDLEDYPGMFLQFNEKKELAGVNAPYPLETKVNPGEFPAEVVTKRANYIARTWGVRTFPWRVFMLSEDDVQLPGNDMVYRLGSPSRIKNSQWIKPGQGTDEWIIGINLFNIPFKAGINTQTYKYYIDFAKKFGFERIMMDAGWSETTDLFKINPDIDMDEIAAYAKQQNVSLSMWTLAHTFNRQLQPALAQFRRWGVDFVMTDFMDRDDQQMVNFYHRIAKACAENEIMIMYHGAFKPAGFSRTWPNAITREGVLGSEYNIWSEKAHPDHDLLLPFIRMTAGPMDYEPGILDNATQKTFRPIGEKVMSMGTRMHQAAMFVVFESPIQIFSGNPSQGILEPEFMSMIGRIPTVWDETIVLDGKVGEYVVIARKKDNKWFIGGMSNWNEKSIDLDLSFLDDADYDAILAIDGVNANRYPSDYRMYPSTFKKSTSVTITMAKGGGFVIELTRK